MSFVINGCGIGTVGRLEQPDGTFITTEWVLVCFIPIFPLKTYQVISEGQMEGVPFIFTNQPFRAIQIPLDMAHVRRIYTGVGILAGIVAALIWFGLHR